MMYGTDILIANSDDEDHDENIEDIGDRALGNDRSPMSRNHRRDNWSSAVYGDGLESLDVSKDSAPLLYEGSDDDVAFFSSSNTSVREYTVEEAVEHMGFGKFQIMVFFVCGLFSATDALEMMLLSVLGSEIRCDWLLPEYKVSLIITVVFAGMFAGSNIWGSWADKYGRLTIMLIACVWIGYFGILCAFSPNYYWMLALRGLVGMGFGGAVQSFTLQAEYLPRKYRPYVLIISQIMWAGGSTFEILLTRVVIAEYGLSWRWLVGLSAIPMVITLCFVWQLPESARYLVASGRHSDASDVLNRVSKMNGVSLPQGRLAKKKKVPTATLR